MREAIEEITSPVKKLTKDDFLSTGSTLLNLAISGTIHGGLIRGGYHWMAGDSSSGKTFLTLTCLAEACINSNFDDYDLILDNVEDGALMDIRRYFGRLADRLQPPMVAKDGSAVHSRTAELFYFNLHDRLQLVKKGKQRRFVYLLDSMDALLTDYQQKKFNEKKKASQSGEKAAGDYGDGKAALNSRYMRDITADLRDTGCILIVLSQTRDNLKAGMFDPEKQTVAGGRALRFYAQWQLWSSVGKKLFKLHNGVKRQTGIICKLNVKKNRITGKEWKVEVPIYHSTGMDDTGSMVDFLVKEKMWKGNRDGFIEVPDWEFAGKRVDLIRKIEMEGLETELKLETALAWKRIEESCRVERKNRYAQED